MVRKGHLADGPGDGEGDHPLSYRMDRRRFMVRAAAVGLTAAAFPAFLAACAQLEAEEALPPSAQPAREFPTPTPFSSHSPNPAPTAAVSTPTATAAPTPLPTPTPQPTLQPTAFQPGPTPAPTMRTLPASVVPTPSATQPQPTARPAQTPTALSPPTASPPTPTPAAVAPAREPLLHNEEKRISHLVWRAGFGASPGELERFRSMGLGKAIDHLVDFDDVDDSAVEGRLDSQNLDLQRLNHLQRWWLQRMAYSSRPLQEKMTLFWHGILTSSFRRTGRGPQMLEQNRLFRREGMGRYDAMLKSISRDPAMMIYLDSRSNKKAAPNENYSRELMELFSLGLGHYSERDVRESARAFTGWQLKNKTEFVFNRNQHDYGVKRFLGRAGNFDGDDIVDIIMAQPAAAEYVCSRLWRFLAYPDPERSVISRLAEIFRSNDYRIRPVVRAIFESEEFYSDRAVAALVKSPAELAAGSVRILGIDTDFKRLDRPIESMGQVLFDPPNVAGWPEGAAWLNSSSLFQRINMANTIATARSGPLRFDAAALLDGRDPGDAGGLVDFLGDLMLGSRLGQPERDLLTLFLESLDSPAFGLEREPMEEKLRSVVYLLLASPEYQLV